METPKVVTGGKVDGECHREGWKSAIAIFALYLKLDWWGEDKQSPAVADADIYSNENDTILWTNLSFGRAPPRSYLPKWRKNTSGPLQPASEWLIAFNNTLSFLSSSFHELYGSTWVAKCIKSSPFIKSSITPQCVSGTRQIKWAGKREEEERAGRQQIGMLPADPGMVLWPELEPHSW